MENLHEQEGAIQGKTLNTNFVEIINRDRNGNSNNKSGLYSDNVDRMGKYANLKKESYKHEPRKKS